MDKVLLTLLLFGVNLCSSAQSADPGQAQVQVFPDSLKEAMKAEIRQELMDEILDQIRMDHPEAPEVPESVTFAGKAVRFDTDDLYERMDRELIAFTYLHSNSTLMLQRSERIFAQVVPILKANGVPEDLKYLMAIESNLDPKAYSSAGAAGLWQFMKATGIQYGLEVSSEVDERYNIEKATAAACKYLKDIYSKHPDWMTVAACYNAGPGGVGRRLESQRQSSSMRLYLPEETSRYMFRILAAKLFFEDPASFGYTLTEEGYYPYRQPAKVVTVDYEIPSLVDFAIANGITYLDLRKANPWLIGTKLTNASKKTYRIVIPAVR